MQSREYDAEQVFSLRHPRQKIILTLLLAVWFGPVHAAELVMFEQAACPWCAAFDREIGPIYAKTAEGRRAPLRRVDIAGRLPSDLAFIRVERLTPLFVLVDNGREIGRIRGYPGQDHFWGLLGALVEKIETPEKISRDPNQIFDASPLPGGGG